MIILGLTGSIGMGKTTAAKAFRQFGVAVHDADRAVHGLMQPGGAAVAAVLRAFPEAARDGAIDRQVLGSLVFADDDKLRRLEAILHPLVRRLERDFLGCSARRGERLVVLDIPLLLETGGGRRCDGVVVVSAPALVQRRRVLARPGMTEEKFQSILDKQMDDGEKRRRADFVVRTGIGKHHGLRQIGEIVRVVRTWTPRHWPPGRESKHA